MVILAKECVNEAAGEGYMGTNNRSEKGVECISWVSVAETVPINPYQFPDSSLALAENYCRNPGAHRDRPWCYTSIRGDQWDYCSIDPCGERAIISA